MSRYIVWAAFGLVIYLRFWGAPDWWRGPENERGGNRLAVEITHGREERRFRRTPSPIRPPASAVPSDLLRLEIKVPEKAADELRSYFWGGWRGARQERPQVLATVREGGAVYTNVFLHLKGSAGSFRPFDDKPAMTLNFSKGVSGRRFHGFGKISLNNSVQDSSYLCEAVSREMFEAAGIPAPQASHATVVLNGRDLGLYVLVEGFGKPFLKRHFSNVKGNLYDGGFCQEVSPELDLNSGDYPEDRSAIERLLAAAMEPDGARRWEQLNAVLDMDRFLTFVAMEILTCHWDGYAMNRNNYRIFHDRETDRLIFMPHGMDQMFGVFNSSPQSSIQPQMRGRIAQAVMSTAEGRRKYLERLGSLRTNVFVEERWTNRVRELSEKIRPTLAAYHPHLAAEHDAQAAFLMQRIVERAQSVSEQLTAPEMPIELTSGQSIKLTNWAPRITSPQPGLIQFARNEKDARPALHIVARQGGGSGSWRTRVLLPSGHYRFEGRVKTKGVGRNGGVCLRVSGAQIDARGLPDGEWTDISFELFLPEPGGEVVLVCELRAAQGEAWFDADSLRIARPLNAF